MRETSTTTAVSAHPHSVSRASEAFAIAAGGALGASLRYAVAQAAHATRFDPLWSTASANLLGAFLLGMLVGPLESRAAHPLLRPFLVVGVFGSFTTFSALAFDNRLLASHSGELVAVLHLAASIASGLIAFVAGSALGRSRE